MSGKNDQDLDEGDNEVTCRFVIPSGRSEATVTDDLARAFERCQESGLNPQWVEEQEVLNISPTKTVQFIHGELDVFVMDPFSGPAFNHITSGSKYKSTVVGPRCLLHCLDRDMAIPEMPYPIYTAAMYGLTVTVSDLDPTEKERLRVLIQRMSGVVSKTFHEGVTHLVAGSVGSKKYQAAATKEIPVMLPSWVDDVFKVSNKENVTGTDPRFSSLRCPVLKGMVISVSQMARKDKDLMKKMVENHGGQYMPSLEQDVTKVLVCATPSGDKYNYAKKWKLPCVTSEWVTASVDKGYCLDFTEFRVDGQKAGSASTPTKQDRTLSEVSFCSTILNPDDTMGTHVVEDTVNSTALEASITASLKGKTTANWLDELDLSKVKKAGNFLDGCKVYLSGFTEHETVPLTRVLKFGGGVRLTQLVESVTHVVHAVGHVIVPETSRLLAQMDLSPHHVSIQWMVESMKCGKSVLETDYPFPPAPDTQGILSPPTGPPLARHNETETQFEAHLLAQYGGQGAVANPTSNSTTTSTTMTDTAGSMSQVAPFLQGLKLELVGFDEETQQDLTDWVTEAGGELIYSDYTGMLDYLIVPVTGGSSKHKVRNVVSSYWLEDCLDAGELLPIGYHHHPLVVDKELKPLVGVVTCLSGYSGREREYLTNLVEALGGCPQDIFAKRDNKSKGAKESTHLICPEGNGDKYGAAVKWGRCVVTKDWLTASLRDMVWVSEQPFLVGDAKTVTEGKPLPRPIVEEKITEDKMEDTLVENNTTVNDQTMEEERDQSVCRRMSEEISFPGVGDHKIEPETPVTAVKTKTNVPMDTSDIGIDTPTMERLRPKPININEISVTPQRWADSQPSPSQAPQSTKRKRDDVKDILDTMKTPETPYGAHFVGPNPSPRTRKFYKKESETMPKFQLTEFQTKQKEQFELDCSQRGDRLAKQREEADRIRKEEERRLVIEMDRLKRQHEERLDQLQAKGIPILGRDPRTFDQIMEERYGKKKVKEPEVEKGVLTGVVAVVSKKLSGQSSNINVVLCELGGEMAWHLGEGVTHFIFQGSRQHDISKDFRQAREMGCEIVAPDWVFACQDEGERVPESSYPHTYNPRKKLNITGTPTSTTTVQLSQMSMSQQRLARDSQDKFHNSLEMDVDKSMVVDSQDDTTEPPTDSMKMMAEVSADLANMENLLSSVTDTPTTSGSRKVVKTILTTQDNKRLSYGNQNEEDKEEPTEGGKESQVLWVDPTEEIERKRLADQLNAIETQDMTMDTMGSMNIPENLTAMMDADKENEKDKVIIVSGWSDGDNSVQEAVTKLGKAKISQTSQYDPDTTHMVATKVSRSEKMLCSMAAGKWVLHPSFISASLTAGKWLPEERFEWGNPASQFLPEKTSDSLEARLASASRRWRQQGGGGAFQGMKVILHMPDNKLASFTRLVTAGGGEVVQVKPPYTYQKTGGTTHLLTESRYVAKGQIDFTELAGRGIPVLKLTYLNDFLTSDQQTPNLETQLLDEFKPVWEEQNKKRSRVTTDTPTSTTKRSKSFTRDTPVNGVKKTVLGKVNK